MNNIISDGIIPDGGGGSNHGNQRLFYAVIFIAWKLPLRPFEPSRQIFPATKKLLR